MSRRRRIGTWSLVIVAGLAAPWPARAAADFWSRGSIAIAGYRDDNLLSTAGPGEEDTVRRLTPAVETGFRSGRLWFAARYAQDAESFAAHPDLDTLRARQSGDFELESRATRALTVSLRGTYARTLAPGELNLETGLLAGRSAATRLTLDPSLVFRPGERSTGRAGLALARDDLDGGIGSRTGRAFLGLERRTSVKGAAGIEYAVTRYVFDSGEPATAHSLSLGWEGALGRRTNVSVRGGPRYSGGAVDPEGALTLSHDRRRVDLSLSFNRSLATVIGRSGTVTTTGISPALAVRPGPRWSFTVAPHRYRTR
ncbi:MAG: hypothetical protein ACRD5D_08985, partial [Candidatus Polarisedimenticolia bacterium]